MPKLSRPLRRPPVIPKHPAQPFPAFYSTIAAPLAIRTFDQLVAKALVIPLAMVVRDVLRDASAKMALSKRNDLCQTLGLDRPNEPLRIGVCVWSLVRSLDRCDPGVFEDDSESQRELGVSIVVVVCQNSADLYAALR